MSATNPSYQSLTAPSHRSAWKVLPTVGLGSLLLALCFAIATLVIGLVSNGVAQDSWMLLGNVVQPSVLFSLAATLTNALLRVAFIHGVASSWWSQAHQRVSLGKLSVMYEHAWTFHRLFRFEHFSRVTLASFAMLLLLADGPLLQRASTVQRQQHTHVQDIIVPVSSSPLNFGSTGIITSHDGALPNLYTPEFGQVVQQYNGRSNYSIPGLQESETMTLTLVAPGWDVQCQDFMSTYRLLSLEEFIESLNDQLPYTPPASEQIMFTVNVTYGNNDGRTEYQIQLSASYKSTPGGNGTMSWRKCNLTEALVRYPIRIENGAVMLQSMPSSENRTVQIVRRSNEMGGWGNFGSTLGGLWLAMQQQFATSASLTLQPGTGTNGYAITTENAVANQYINHSANFSTLSTFDVMWTDPTNDILAMANELTLRAAIGLTNYTLGLLDAAPTLAQPEITYPNLTTVNRTISQQVTATMVDSGNVYHTDLGWLIGGVLTMLLTCALIAPMYWGWWNLDREYTMNPLDTAKAFDAPLLRSADPFTPPTAWGRSVKDTRVYYGRGSMKSEAGIAMDVFDDRARLVRQTDHGFDGTSGYWDSHRVGGERYSHALGNDGGTGTLVPKFHKVD